MENKMTYVVEYSEDSIRDLEKLDWHVSVRIRKKVRFFALQKNPLQFSESLTGLVNRYKWRIGKWRVIFEKNQKTNELVVLWILEVEKRDKVYKNLA